MVFEVRDLWPELPIAMGALKGPAQIALARRLERFAYHNAAAIVALSPGMREGIIAAGYPPEQVTVIPNSCDIALYQAPREHGLAFRAQQPWLGDRPMVLYAGTLGRINGVGYLARIAAEMRALNPDVRFVIVGDGMEREVVAKQAEELGVLGQSLFLLEPMPKREMPALFSAATVCTSLFVDLPQMWSNSANKFFDALAAGRPVAINYQGWQADLLRGSGAGVVLPPDDAPVAAALLAQVLGSREFLSSAGEAALHLARTQFDRDVLARDLESVLLGAVERGRMSRGRR
jgi:glycosyltransferase involved in cell wall biosynthesis